MCKNTVQLSWTKYVLENTYRIYQKSIPVIDLEARKIITSTCIYSIIFKTIITLNNIFRSNFKDINQ